MDPTGLVRQHLQSELAATKAAIASQARSVQEMGKGELEDIRDMFDQQCFLISREVVRLGQDQLTASAAQIEKVLEEGDCLTCADCEGKIEVARALAYPGTKQCSVCAGARAKEDINVAEDTADLPITLAVFGLVPA
jgi:RNA polymerase-binding transcription factor DksA